MDKKPKTSARYMIVSFRIDPDVFAQVNALAAGKGITTSAAFRRAISRYLKATTKGASQ